MPRVVIAIGGNALLQRGEKPDAETQLRRLGVVAPALARIASGNQMVIVHGNGPQVGLLASESTADSSLTRPYPLSDMVAETQGLLGAWLQRSLANGGLATPVVSVVSQTLVDANDPAMHAPTKFIGPVLTREEAKELEKLHGWPMAADGAAWRRVVPSPMPLGIVEEPIALTLLDAGVTVILAGGGGVPVTRSHGRLVPVDAVVDKDGVAAALAIALDADLLIILTDVPGVMANYGTPSARVLRSVVPGDLASEDFAAGSMGPKIAAISRFVLATGRRAAIGSLEDAEQVVSGNQGTQMSPAGLTASASRSENS